MWLPRVFVSVLVSACAFSALAVEVIIDDFTEGPGFVGSSAVGYFDAEDIGLDPSHTIGGSRRFAVQACLHVPPYLPIEHDPDLGVLTVGGLENSQWCEGAIFEYGWSYDRPEAELNVDLLGQGLTHLEFDLLAYDRGGFPSPIWSDHPASLELGTIFEGQYSSGRPFVRSASRYMDFTLPEVVGPTTVRIPLPEAMLSGEGNFDPQDIDVIGIYTGGADRGALLSVAEIRLVRAEPHTPGDIDGSGSVEQGDLNLVLNNWGVSPENLYGDISVPAGWVNSPPSETVNQAHLNAVLNHWGSAVAPTGISVPEPAGIAVLGGLAFLGIRCRGDGTKRIR